MIKTLLNRWLGGASRKGFGKRKEVPASEHGIGAPDTSPPASGVAGMRLQLDADEARKVAVRFVFDEMVASSRALWVGGITTGTDLAVLTDRVRFHLGLTREEVNAALDGHPRPATVG